MEITQCPTSPHKKGSMKPMASIVEESNEESEVEVAKGGQTMKTLCDQNEIMTWKIL